MAIRYKGSVVYPPLYNEVAQIIGKLRDDYNAEMRSQVPRYNTQDKDMSLMVDIIGVLGEMIFSYYLTTKGIDHKVQKLLDDKPVTDYDVMIGDKTIDVKVVNPKYTNFIINYESHYKKRMDYYAFVKPVDYKVGHIWVCDYDDVNSWNVRDLQHGKAFLEPTFYE